jgi:peptidoglycan-N-acetylglucosamine deacetylase
MSLRSSSAALGLTLFVLAIPPVPVKSPSKVALTFDDLPAHAALPPGLSRVDVAQSVIATLRAHHAPPTYGFVNAKRLQDGPSGAEVLRLWRAAGHPLGNHAFSHMDLHASTPEAFEKDILADEESLRASMGDQDWRWFRFPYLHEGDTPEKRVAVTRFLADHGYRVAEVTMSFNDWAYNDPYARCAAKNDHEAIEWMKQSYLRRAGDCITAAQEAAKRVYGRDISHVMLLHLGGFQTVMLPKLLALLEERGFRLVTLPEAQGDPAYENDPRLLSRSAAGRLENMAAARHEAAPPVSDEALTRLAALCR